MAQKFLFSAIITLVVSLIFAFLQQDEDLNENSFDADARDSLHSRSRTQVNSDFAYDLALAFNGNSKSRAKIEEWLVSADQIDISDKLQDLREAYLLNPDFSYKGLEEIALSVSEENPINSLRMLELLSVFPKVANLERHILDGWIDQNSQEVFLQLADPQAVHSEHFYSIVSSLYQNEKVDQFSEFLVWGQALKEKAQGESAVVGARDRWQSYLEKVSAHVQPDTLQDVAGFLQKNLDDPYAVAQLGRIVPQFVESIPEESLSWLSSLTLNNEDRSLVIGSAVQALSKHHPEEAARLLDPDHFITNFFQAEAAQIPADLEKAQEKFYDDMLQNYLLETVLNSPEVAIENTELFFNQEYKEGIVNIAMKHLKK